MADGVGYPLAAVVKHDIGRGSTRAFSVGGTTRYFGATTGHVYRLSCHSYPLLQFLLSHRHSRSTYRHTVARTKQLEQSRPGSPGA